MTIQLRGSAAERHHDVLHDVEPSAATSVEQIHGAVVDVVEVEGVNALLGADQNDLVIRLRVNLKKRGGICVTKNDDKSNRVRTADAFWRSAHVLVSDSSGHSFIFPMLFCSNSAHFPEIQLMCDGRTDGHTLL